MDHLHNFFYPRSRYYGQFKPETLAFNANLQEFAQRVSLIANLETGGKISPADSYFAIRGLWKQLKSSHDQLGIGQPFSSNGDEDKEASK